MAAAWFPVTVVSRSSSCSVRDRGTLPCTAATSAVGTPAPGWPDGSRPPARTRPAAAAKASAGPAWRRAGDGPGRPGPSSSQASVVPARATRNVSSGGPPIATQRTVGAWAWLMASLPQGKA